MRILSRLFCKIFQPIISPKESCNYKLLRGFDSTISSESTVFLLLKPVDKMICEVTIFAMVLFKKRDTRKEETSHENGCCLKNVVVVLYICKMYLLPEI